MRGVLLDSKGRIEGRGPGVLHTFVDGQQDQERILHRAPANVLESLKRSRELSGPGEPRNSLQTWEETLYTTINDGAAVTAAAEATLVPIYTLPANYLYPGRTMKWTVMGRLSSAITTPGTFTFKLSYSATGLGAVAVLTSGAFAPDPTAAATNLTFMAEFWAVCRASGTSGSLMGWGRIDWPDYDDATTTTIVGNLGMIVAPVSAPAVATVDTTVARSLNPTYTPSLATASMTCHAAILEALT